jgi:hypothetical protein
MKSSRPNGWPHDPGSGPAFGVSVRAQGVFPGAVGESIRRAAGDLFGLILYKENVAHLPSASHFLLERHVDNRYSFCIMIV